MKLLAKIDNWEIALVVLVLAAGGLLLAGAPSGPAVAERWGEGVCMVPGEAACVQRADVPLTEGRAVGRGDVDLEKEVPRR